MHGADGQCARRASPAAAAGCSSWASAAARPTARTRSTTSARSAGIEAYAPTDNVSELTARVNDDGWDTVFVEWLRGSRLTDKDMVFVFSVGGGNREKNVSVGLIRAMDYASEKEAEILGVVARDGGYTAKVADICVIVPTVNPETVTRTPKRCRRSSGTCWCPTRR